MTDAGLDRVTLERLYVKLERPIFNAVYRWLWDREEAHDVTQEAFLKVWRARERVDPARAEALLYRAALNLASNRRRSRRVWRWLGLESADEQTAAEPGADEALERVDVQRRLRVAIDALPERLRQVVALSEYAELSYAEISAILQVPMGTVGSRRSAALALLAETMGPIEDRTR